MISNIVVSLFGAAYNWPLGAAISSVHDAAGRGTAVRHRTFGKETGAFMSGELQSRSRCAAEAYAFAGLRVSLSPIVVLIVYSFNGSGVGGFPPRSLTLDWYRQLFADAAIWDAVLNSLRRRGDCSGDFADLRLARGAGARPREFPGKALFRRLVLLPLILPGIITGLSLLMLFVAERT